MTELRACPFCGGEAELCCNGPTPEQVQQAVSWQGDYDVSYYVRCMTCQQQFELPTKEMAVAAWNTRADLSAPVDLDAVKQKLQSCLAYDLPPKGEETRPVTHLDVVISKVKDALALLDRRG